MKFKIITQKINTLEYEDGRKIEIKYGDIVSVKLVDGRFFSGTVCAPEIIEPFSIALKNAVFGTLTIKWNLISEIKIIGYDDDRSLCQCTDWHELINYNE